MVNLSEFESIVKSVDGNYQVTQRSFKNLESKRVLIACSGGADSVGLAILGKVFDIEFGLAYIDHGINIQTRNSEVIVKEIANLCDVPFFTYYLDMSEKNMVTSNVEANARQERYIALEEIRSIHGYDIVATAHHMDDYAETYLINLIRGSGSGGASLEAQRNNLVRPILHWRKSDLVELVQQCGLTHYEDKMNLDPRFVRNRIRNEVMELLDDIAGRDVTPLIARAAGNIARDTKFLARFASSQWPKGQARTHDLVSLDPVLQVHALREWIGGYPPSTDEMDRILAVARHEILSTQISGNRTIRRSGAILYQDITLIDKTTSQEG